MPSQRVYLDTEFSDFIDCQLISIGLISEDGREFYGERTDFDMGACSAFVREAVLPQLGKEPAVVGTEEELRQALLEWLAKLGPVEICIDYSTDWDLFLDLCQERPAGVTARLISSELDQTKIEQYWRENGRRAHHALHDAKANRFAFSPI